MTTWTEKPARLLCPWGFSRQEYWSGLPCPPPGDRPNPGIEPRSPALQTDSSPSEPPRKPIYVLSNSHVFSPVLLTTITMCASIHIRSWEQLFPPIFQRLYPLTTFTYFPHPPGPHNMSLFLWVQFLFYFYFFDFTYNWDHTVFIFYYVTYFT